MNDADSTEEYKDKHLSEFDYIKGAVKIIELVFPDVELSDDECIIIYVRGTKVGIRAKRFKNWIGNISTAKKSSVIAKEVLRMVIDEMIKDKGESNE